MEILMDNYIWIIVIVVIILMTIIGYIAEKTNFGKKEFSKKKTDKKVEEKKDENVVVPVVKAPKAEETLGVFEAPKELIQSAEKKHQLFNLKIL